MVAVSVDYAKYLFFIGSFAFALCTSALGLEKTAAILRSGLPSENPTLVDAIARHIRAAGYKIREIDFDGLCDQKLLTPSGIDLLVLPDASTLPARAVASIENYLRIGGDIIALNTPMWQRSVIRAGERWLTRDEYQHEMPSVTPEHVIFDFASTGVTNWTRSSDNPQTATNWQVEDAGPGPGQCSLHVCVPKLTNWDTLQQDAGPTPFRKDNVLTVFSAKGGPNTKQLSIEWTEKDGSRWIAVVPLKTEWRQYVLTPRDFRFWHSVPQRGFPGDVFKPENAQKLSIGLAFTHTTSIGPGPHEYWVGPIGTARMKPEFEEFLAAAESPKLDTLSPSYKLFECRDVGDLVVREDQVIVTQTRLPLPKKVRSVQPRPRGAGFDKGRDWRWIPIVEARSAKGEWRGVPVAITVHANGPYKGGIWTSFGISDPNWYLSPNVLNLVEQIAERMRNHLFLVDGGANFYTYFEGQQMKLGATVANFDSKAQNLTLRVRLVSSKGSEALDKQITTEVQPGNTRLLCCETPVSDKYSDCQVVCELFRQDKVIDKLVHEIHLWKPKKQKHFVTVSAGEFWLDGKRWRPHGVNYMPSSGIGTEDGAYFEYWLDRKPYDPEVIQRDLEHIKDLGFNSVSIFIYSHSTEAQNLLDILRRLDKLGLKANLSLRPGTPMNFLWPEIRKIIEYYKLWENDTVFAYDLAWEPMFGSHEDRKIWDRDWESWIVDQYGSIENAEKDWGYSVPRDETGKVTNPLPEQIDRDGEWRIMVAAYRRFLDTLLYKKYSEARRLVRSIDPNHLVSFRMAEAGNPTFRWGGRIPYDFPYLAGAVDFLAPEAYGRIGDWERTKPGWFEREYARWAAPMKPMIWAEAGVNTWDMTRMENSLERLEFAADAYTNFYKMLINSAADGVFFWWYPGGFRVGENSDFGIIEPDGTDRKVTKVIREWGPRFVNGPSIKPIDFWITIDRDKHPSGVTGIYEEVSEQFWQAIESGKTPGLRTIGTGTDSCNSPDLAVGNTKPNGTNPLKYLDSAFDFVELRTANGSWLRVSPGDKVNVAKANEVELRIGLTNLGESAWSPQKDCQVSLVGIDSEGQTVVKAALTERVDHLESKVLSGIRFVHKRTDSPSEITLRLYTPKKGYFGEKFRLVLEP